MGGEESKWSSQGNYVSDYELSTTYKYQGSNGLYNTEANSTAYFITPKLAAGTISFWAAGKKESGGANNYVRVYKCTDNGDGTFTIDTSNNLSTHSYYNYTGDDYLKCNKYSLTYTQYSFDLDADSHLAFLVSRAGIDNFSASNGLAADAPAGIGVYTDEDCTASVSDGVNLSYGFVASAQSQTYYIKNESGEDWTNLAISHSGNAEVTSVSSTLADDAKTSFTVSMAASGSTSDEITITAATDLSFTINVSGMVRDANKVYETLGSGSIPEDWSQTSWSFTTGYAYTSSWYQSSNARLITPKLDIKSGEKIMFEAIGTYPSTPSYQTMVVEYSSDKSTWTASEKAITLTSDWQTVEIDDIPVGSYYIAIHASQARVRNYYGGELPKVAKMTVTEPATLDFGLYDKDASPAPTKTFTIANTGTATLNGINVTSANAAFAITGAPTSLAAGADAEVTITMSTATAGALSSLITISATDMEDASFTVTGAVKPAGMPVEEFSGTTIPSGWTSTGSWSFTTDGVAVGTSSSAYLYTPKLKFSDGDFIIIKAKNTDGDASDYITVAGSINEGNDNYTAYSKKITVANNSDYATFVVTDIPTTVNKIRFTGGWVNVDEIHGLNYAPVLAVTKDETPVSSPAAYDFGEQAANASVTYNFANAGAGTINITNVAITGDGAAAYSTNWSESVATPFDLIITRTYDAERVGNQEAAITVTTSEGNFIINVQGTDMAADAPVLAVALGGDAVSDGDAVSFGTRLTAAPSAKTFTITNSGTGTLAGTIASSASDQFTVSKTSFSLGAGESTTFDLALVFNETYGSKGANITIHPTNDGLEDIVISASAFTYDPESWIEDFAGGSLPTGWENTTWTVGTFSSYENKTAMALAPSGSSAGSLITPCLTAKEGDVLTWDAYFNWYDEPMTVEYSTNKSSWTKIYDSYKANTDFGDTRYTHKEMSFTAPADGDYYLRFTSTYSNGVDNFIGFKPCAQAPILAVFSDAEATASVTSGTTKDFGWANTAQSATYYITNSGTGTLTISEISAVDGFTATAGNVMTVAAGADPLALTITMTNAAVGAKSGIFTLTTDGGNFEIPVKGFIYGDRNLVDFTDASQYQGWTGVNVTDNAATLSSTAIETTPFAATAAEPLYVEIKGNSSYTTHSFSYSYSRDGGANWSEATALVASTYSAVPDQVFTITDIADAEAASNVMIRFTGAGLSINRIYGFEALTVPVMTLDKTADYNFGMQTANAEYVITVTNTGTATLNNLAATLESGTNYSVAITKPKGESTTTVDALTGKATVPAGQQAVITVTQVFDANNGLASLSDVLTISGDDVASKVINLSGQTRDASKWYVDFASANPDGIISKDGWTISTYYGYASVTTESALVSQTLTLAANEAVQFDAKKMSYGEASLKVRHSLNGGLSWSDYTDFTDTEGFNSSTYKTMQYSVGNTDASAVAMIEFLGANVYLDNIYGGALNNEAPMIQVKKGSSVVESGVAEAFGTILSETSAEYTIKNIGHGTLTITSAVTVTGDATATISETSLANNESATLTITMPVEAPYGEKAGVVTVETSLGDFVINYTATTKNPNTLNVDFSDGQLPAGWYNDGWNVDYYEKNIQRSNSNSDTYFMTQKLQVTGNEDVLKFDAKKYGSKYASSTVLKVSYSTDRVNWTEIGDYASEMTTSWKTFEISGLEAGEYYLKFTGRYANVDNIIGWEKVAGIDHDLYVTATSFPAATDKGDDATISATVTSLRTAETGVYAKLFIDGEISQTADAQAIALNGTNTFSFTYAIPKKKTAQIKVYYSDDTEAFATAVNIMKVNYTMDETSTPKAFDAGIYDVKLTYTKDAEKLGTICLPFATTTEELSEAYGTTVKIYELTGRAENVITFNGVDELTAGTPYLIYSDEALSGEKSFEDKTVVAAAGNSEASSVTFQGIYAPTSAGNWEADWYGVTSEGKIAKGTETTTMKGLRAYFTGNVADARIFIMDDEGTTRIATINRGGVAIDDAAVYNLNGQKVQNAKKGLYIVNGRKVVIK